MSLRLLVAEDGPVHFLTISRHVAGANLSSGSSGVRRDGCSRSAGRSGHLPAPRGSGGRWSAACRVGKRLV